MSPEGRRAWLWIALAAAVLLVLVVPFTLMLRDDGEEAPPPRTCPTSLDWEGCTMAALCLAPSRTSLPECQPYLDEVGRP